MRNLAITVAEQHRLEERQRCDFCDREAVVHTACTVFIVETDLQDDEARVMLTTCEIHNPVREDHTNKEQ